MGFKLLTGCLFLGIVAITAKPAADSIPWHPALPGSPWNTNAGPWGAIPAPKPPLTVENNPWIPPWIPKWVPCGDTPLGVTSCSDCKTRLICTWMGGLQIGCLNPLQPYCNLGACTATPNAGCSNNTPSSDTQNQVNVAKIPFTSL